MFKIVIIIISLILSLIMSIIPLPDGLLQMNPAWCLLTLLFWTYMDPRKVNVGVAFCVGILVDGLTGSLLGMHAFSFVIAIYVFDFFYRRFHMFHVLQQSLVIGLLVAGNFFIFFCISHMMTDNLIIWSEILSAVTSALCWPFYRSLGRKLNFARS